MEKWLSENAPRACKLETKAQWNLWARKQIEDYDEPEYHRHVRQGYWLRCPKEKSWKFHQGILPNFEESSADCALGLYSDAGMWEESFYETGEGKALSRSSRKGVLKGMKQMVVSEVFSPPRVCQVGKELGHVDGGSFDLKNGYDLLKRTHRKQVFRELQEADPDLLVICPPCGPFSILQNLNLQRGDGRAMELKLSEGKEHLRFGMRLYEWEIRRGKLAVFEHPATSRAWEEPEVKRILSMPEVQRVRADQCRYGLAVKGKHNRKPTDFMVNGRNLAKRLSRRCQKEHEQQPLIGAEK